MLKFFFLYRRYCINANPMIIKIVPTKPKNIIEFNKLEWGSRKLLVCSIGCKL